MKVFRVYRAAVGGGGRCRPPRRAVVAREQQLSHLLPDLRVAHGVQDGVGHGGHLGQDVGEHGHQRRDVVLRPEQPDESDDDVRQPGRAEDTDYHNGRHSCLNLRLGLQPLAQDGAAVALQELELPLDFFNGREYPPVGENDEQQRNEEVEDDEGEEVPDLGGAPVHVVERTGSAHALQAVTSQTGEGQDGPRDAQQPYKNNNGAWK